MTFKEIFYPESNFGGFTDVDGTIAFYARVNSLLEPSFVVLDFGCGIGVYSADCVPLRRDLRILKGKVQRVVGLDVDAAAEENPYIDEFHLLGGDSWPLPDDSIDLCVCDSVLEHLARPESFFSECRRVLRSEGYLCIRTTNIRGYVGAMSRLIPDRVHRRFLGKVQDRRNPSDIFPTVYSCNTTRKIRAMLARYGFKHVAYGYEAEPSYFSFSKVAYWLGVIHQRHAPASLRVSIFAFARLSKQKPDDTSRVHHTGN